MKTEKEIREMLECAIDEIQHFLSGSGEQVWQDGFVGALRMVLGENEHIHQMHHDALAGIATCTLCGLAIKDKQTPKTRAQKDAELIERNESRDFGREMDGKHFWGFNITTEAQAARAPRYGERDSLPARHSFALRHPVACELCPVAKASGYNRF